MKTTFHAIFFFLFAFVTNAFVLDTDSEPLRNAGGQYYILPVLRGNGGGLGFASADNETCPLTIVQTPSEPSKGLPVRMLSRNRIEYLWPGMLLGIKFTEALSCVPKPTTRETLDELPSNNQSSVIVTDSKAFDGRFKVEEFGNEPGDYKFVYCFSSSHDSCVDLGIDTDGNNRLLALKDGDPLVVKFQRALPSFDEWSIVQ